MPGTLNAALYVDAATGSDGNDGFTLATAFATIGKALEVAVGFVLPNATSLFIRVRAGTYTENIISATQTFPTGFSSFPYTLEAYNFENVIIRPASGTNVMNLTVASSLVAVNNFFFIGLTFDGVNVLGDAVSVSSSCTDLHFRLCKFINAASGTGIVVDSTCQRIDITDGEANNNLNGIAVASQSNTVARMNVYSNTTSGIVATASSRIYQNLVHANLDGITATNSIVFSNIVYSNTGNGIVCSGTSEVERNTCYGNTVKGFDVTSVTPNGNISFGNGNDVVGAGNNFEADPSFVDVANIDFHLLSSSAAIDTGPIVNAIFDYDGNTLPSGTLYDYGALEFVQPGTSASITTNTTNMVLGFGRACSLCPGDYRMVEAKLKAITGSPISGLVLAVPSTATAASFTGYGWIFDCTQPHGIGDRPLRLVKWNAQPLTAEGTFIAGSNHLTAFSTSIGDIFNLMVGTNTAQPTRNINGYKYDSTNIFDSDSTISRANTGYGIVGLGASVSITVSGDDIIVDCGSGNTMTWQFLRAGCMNAPINEAAFDETFTFNTPPVYRKDNIVSNFGFYSEIDVDIKCHCLGEDCPGAFWTPAWNQTDVDPQGGDNAGDTLEIEATYGGIVAGTPRTGIIWDIRQPFTSGIAAITAYGLLVDETDQTVKLVRWNGVSGDTLRGLGTVLASVSMSVPAGTLFNIFFNNDGSIRNAGDPIEIDVYMTTSYTQIMEVFDPTPFGQVCQYPNELWKWRNTVVGLCAVGTQSGNPADIAKWNNYIWFHPDL